MLTKVKKSGLFIQPLEVVKSCDGVHGYSFVTEEWYPQVTKNATMVQVLNGPCKAVGQTNTTLSCGLNTSKKHLSCRL